MNALEHLRVVELATEIAGPYLTKLFCDAGAEVVKVEPAGGDPLRATNAVGVDLSGADGALFQYLNGGKKSVVGSPQDRWVAELLAGADLVVEDLGPTGLDVDALRAAHPHLVVVSISPFGSDGPYAGRPASEFTVQAESGSILYRGRPTKPPLHAGGRVTEYLTGVYAAVPALAAIRKAGTTGIGDHVDVSMTEVMSIAASTFADLSHHLMGRPPLDTAARSLETPSIERAKDGYVGFNTNTAQMFQSFLLMIERPDLIDDTELATFGGRQRRPDWPGIVSEWMIEHTVEEIVDLASALRIPVAPVCDGAALLANAHMVARGVFVEHPGGFRQPRPPYRLAGEADFVPRSAPALGADQDKIAPRVRPSNNPGARPGDAGPVDTGDEQRPLAGLKVLDMTSWWAGPSATHALALLGAEVVHVESTTHPDGMRLTGYMFGREKWWEWGHMFAAANTDKSGITVDVSQPAGRELCARLVEWADVVAENFAPRVMENWGLDAAGIAAINSRAVFVRMPAFGLTGPWRDRVGFAQTMEQMTMASITGYESDPPLIPRGPCDPNAGMHAAFATLVGLVKRDRDGDGVFVESTMVEAAINVCPQPVLEYSAYGVVMNRMGNRSPYAAPQGVYGCAGFEQWLAVTIATDEQWAALVDVLGSPSWATSDDLATRAGRVVAHETIDAGLMAWAGERDLDTTVDLLLERGIPAARCWDPRVQSFHPQLQARRFYETVDHPELGTHPVPGMPYRLASVDTWTKRPTALMGEHNVEVLGGLLGIDGATLARLEADGVIGTRPRGM